MDKDINVLLDKAYNNYCRGDEHCYFSSCPVNALMFNFGKHMKEKDPFLLAGDYFMLEELSK